MDKKKIMQSYPVTTMRGKMTVQQTRILARIVERCQPTINAQGDTLRTLVNKGQLDPPQMQTFGFTAHELVGSKTHNYSGLKKAIKGLQERIIEYYDYNTRTWHSASLIANATIEDGTGRVLLTCPAWLLSYICDFSRGASIYDVVRAFQLKRASSVRLYMLLANQNTQITYTIGQLRKWLGGDGYTQNRDFIRRVIEPARQELEASGSNGFSYIINKNTDKPTSPIKSLTFTPIHREEITDAELLAKIGARSIIPTQYYNYLITNLGFTAKGIGANKGTIAAFFKADGWETQLADIVTKMKKGGKGAGYVVYRMKKFISR